MRPPRVGKGESGLRSYFAYFAARLRIRLVTAMSPDPSKSIVAGSGTADTAAVPW